MGSNGSGGNAGCIGTGGKNGLARESAWDTKDQFWINDSEKGWSHGYNFVVKGSAGNGETGLDNTNDSGQMQPEDFDETMKVVNLKLREGLEELASKPRNDAFDKLQYQTIKKFENSINWTTLL